MDPVISSLIFALPHTLVHVTAYYTSSSTNTMTASHNDTASNGRPITFRVTGSAAHGRFQPLVPSDWIDTSPYNTASTKAGTADDDAKNEDVPAGTSAVPDFLWENAPRHETKAYRDVVRCYSHLPNGTDILDSKWVLARLLGGGGRRRPEQQEQQHHEPSSGDSTTTNPSLATLEAHCFRGRQGFQQFAQQMELLEPYSADTAKESFLAANAADLPDLGDPNRHSKSYTYSAPAAPNWWVVKDASSNGAGGIWVLGPSNAATMTDPSLSPLLPDHRYVAQRYAWPTVLYQGRKTHIRVYGCMTSDGRAWIHRKCFLHVANDPFYQQQQQSGDDGDFCDSVHITNCCANSDNPAKFAGEICATLFNESGESSDDEKSTPSSANNSNVVIDLAEFFPSIEASMAALADRTFYFLQGGNANNGLEYLGLDFILSYNSQGQPLAYLLEVNAPPSQDTATGLPHAENLHNAVLRDLMTLWVIPKVTGSRSKPGGWRCVYQHDDYPLGDDTGKTIPSKAATLNRMRWALFEKKAAQRDSVTSSTFNPIDLAKCARAHFDYYSKLDSSSSKGVGMKQPIFWENAGGTQVPRQVIQRMTTALQHRHRNVVGTQLKHQARKAVATILGASDHDYDIWFGANATSLLSKAAEYLSQEWTEKDEIVLSIENHWAHVKPWKIHADRTGARIVWWDNLVDDENESIISILSSQTRVVAVSHASNVLGQARDLKYLVKLVRAHAPRALVVVDGVAAAPHLYAAVEDVDMYAVSCHKLFGPHLGALCVKKAILGSIDEMETGTVNFEACAGIQGVLDYFGTIGRTMNDEKVGYIHSNTKCESKMTVERVYAMIEQHESRLVRVLVNGLSRSSKVHFLSNRVFTGKQLPIVSFVHSSISCAELVGFCNKEGIFCRQGTFLASQDFLKNHHPNFTQGFVRFSLVHYNTLNEVKRVIQVLETLPDWF